MNDHPAIDIEYCNRHNINHSAIDYVNFMVDVIIATLSHRLDIWRVEVRAPNKDVSRRVRVFLRIPT